MYTKLIAMIAAGVLTASHTSAEISDVCHNELNDRTATILVGSKAGGGADTYARAIAPILADTTGLETRVVNNTAGGGSVARSLVHNSDNNEIIMYFGGAESFALEGLPDNNSVSSLSYMDMLGIAYRDKMVWLSNENLDIMEMGLSSLAASSLTLESSLFRVALVGRALGIDVDIVAGYDGSNELASAVLRNEVDITALSYERGVKLSSDGDLKIALVLSDSSDNSREVPYLLGQGGVIEARSHNISEQEKSEREAFGEIATLLSGYSRALLVSNEMDPNLRNCLRQGVDVTLSSPELLKILNDQGAPLEPIVGDEAIKLANDLVAAFNDSRSLVEELLLDQEGQ